jgi:uncharacterized protein with NRDE domain
MCLILFALDSHARYPLIIAANRDESYERPAAPLAFWSDAPGIAGGRDLDAGGTWLGITRQGRWAALTNFRRAGSYKLDAPSRGTLVSEFLKDDSSPPQYLDRVAGRAGAYNGFNLLVGIGPEAWYFSNHSDRPQRLGSGAHGLSNHLLNTPWPKVAAGRRFLSSLADLPAAQLSQLLLAALQSRAAPPDSELPDTGVGIERERILATPFIVSPTYGTRASTVLLLDRAGRVHIVEQSFGPMGEPLSAASLEFELQRSGAPAHTAD